jgi:hypothetical protein
VFEENLFIHSSLTPSPAFCIRTVQKVNPNPI